MKENTITDGKHFLSGLGQHSWTEDWTGETIEAVVLQIDGKNYSAYIDPDDGYRSTGNFVETNDLIPPITFPPQEVIVENVSVDTIDENDWPCVYHMLILRNAFDEVILKVGTDQSDNYYPMAIFEWHPEKLPINKIKNYE